MKLGGARPELPVAVGIDAWARGLALVARGDLPGATARLRKIEEVLATIPMEPPLGMVRPLVALAAEQLAGVLAVRGGQLEDGLARLAKAVAIEDTLDPNGEPPLWNAPSRLRLGAVLLAAGRAGPAEAVYRQHLERVPGDPWALFGLAQALAAQRSPQAAEARRAFEQAWTKADLTLTSTAL